MSEVPLGCQLGGPNVPKQTKRQHVSAERPRSLHRLTVDVEVPVPLSDLNLCFLDASYGIPDLDRELLHAVFAGVGSEGGHSEAVWARQRVHDVGGRERDRRRRKDGIRRREGESLARRSLVKLLDRPVRGAEVEQRCGAVRRSATSPRPYPAQCML